MVGISLSLAIAIVSIASTLAAPAVSADSFPIRGRGDPMLPDWVQTPIGADSAACNLGVSMHIDGSASGSYNVHIGRPYAGGSGCDYIRDTIAAKVSQSANKFDSQAYTASFGCIDDGYGSTYITFDAGGVFDPEDHASVVDALQERYSMIAFKRDGICALN